MTTLQDLAACALLAILAVSAAWLKVRGQLDLGQ